MNAAVMMSLTLQLAQLCLRVFTDERLNNIGRHILPRAGKGNKGVVSDTVVVLPMCKTVRSNMAENEYSLVL